MISPRTVLRGTHLPALPRPAVPRRGRFATWGRLEPLHLLWLVIWAPWWVGNELPPPSSPRMRGVDMVELPDTSAGGWILNTMDDLRFRFGLSWAAALLLRQVGWEVEAAAVEGAVRLAVARGAVTQDLGGGLGTREAGEAVVRNLHTA